MEDFNNLTAKEIASEIVRLRQLARSGDITLGQAHRLSELEFAMKRIRLATRSRGWRPW